MAEASGDIFGPLDAETGTSEFDALRQAGGNTVTQSSAQANNDSNSFLCTYAGSSGDCSGRVDFTETELFVRSYIYIDSSFELTAFNTNGPGLSIINSSFGDLLILHTFNNNASQGNPTHWSVAGSQLTVTTVTTGMAIDQWIRIDFHWKAGTGADGGAQVWIDGVSIFSEFDNDLSSETASHLLTGYPFGTAPVAGSLLYYDDILGNSAGPIGAYPFGAGTTFDVSVSDGLAVGDTPAGSLTIGATVSDGLLAGDAPGGALTLAQAVSDGAIFDDAAIGGLQVDVSITDGIVVGDERIANLVQALTVSDGVSFGDAILTAITFLVSITDGAVFGDVAIDSSALADAPVTLTFSTKAGTITFTANSPAVVFTASKPEITMSGDN